MLDFIELGLNIKHKDKNIHQQHTQETNNWAQWKTNQTKPNHIHCSVNSMTKMRINNNAKK